MADDVEMTPVEMTPVEMTPVDAAEPPKANPLATPKVETLKLAPQARPPLPSSSAATPGLKPGLKLPTVALKPGLKLPPKPGVASGLKLPPKPGAASGLKLPPKPGVAPGLKLPTTVLKPGLKLPPKPVIRKPGATVTAAPLPKPVAVDAQGVGKLPTVEAKAVDRAATTPDVSANPSPMEALKSVTQKLKGLTQEIPQQAILHKTGIIAEGAMSDAQKEASKHKTARISLSDAMGVAPVKDEHAPMKTIRIKRPIDIPGVTQPAAPAVAPAASSEAPASTSAPTSTPEAIPETAAAPAPAAAQRKTLKISRPGGVVRPAGKFGIKRPSAAKPDEKPTDGAAASAPAAAGEAPVADVADIPEMPNAPVPTPVAAKSDVPDWVMTLSVIVQAAACVAIGALAWFLWENTQLATFCGGLGWAS